MAKILVVEDDQALRDLYVQILTSEGYLIDQAQDGQAGYDAASKGGYDLILLDLVMPKMDGLMVLEKLHQLPTKPDNGLIVVLSNLGKDDVIGKAMELGASGYMIKSDYTPDKIIEQVKNFLDSKNS